MIVTLRSRSTARKSLASALETSSSELRLETVLAEGVAEDDGVADVFGGDNETSLLARRMAESASDKRDERSSSSVEAMNHVYVSFLFETSSGFGVLPLSSLMLVSSSIVA